MDAYATSHFPDYYCGLNVADPAIHVCRKPGSPKLDDNVRTEFPDLELVFVDGQHSRKELQAVSARITKDKEYWYKKDVDIVKISVPSNGGRVEVGVKNDKPPREQFYARYGKEYVKVDHHAGYMPL